MGDAHLFEGAVPETEEAGFALVEEVGDAALVARAAAAAEGLPAETVLAGLSMGAGDRLDALGAPAGNGGGAAAARDRRARRGATAGDAARAHVAEPDPFEEEAWVAWWRDTAAARGLEPQLWRYPAAGTSLPTRRSRSTTRRRPPCSGAGRADFLANL